MFDGGSKISFDLVSKEPKESPMPKVNNMSRSSSGCGRRMSQQMVLSPSTAGEEAITAEEADLAKVAAPAPLEISKGVVGTLKDGYIRNVSLP